MHLFRNITIPGIYDNLECSTCGLTISENQQGEALPKCMNPEFEKVLTLSSRQMQIFKLLGNGLTTEEICQHLKAKQETVSRKTIEAHFANMEEKLGMANIIKVRHLAARFNYWLELNPNIQFKTLAKLNKPGMEVVGAVIPS